MFERYVCFAVPSGLQWPNEFNRDEASSRGHKKDEAHTTGNHGLPQDKELGGHCC